MARRCHLFLSEAFDRLVSGTGLVPFLLVPAMLSLLVWLESMVPTDSGIDWLSGPVVNPLHSRVALALWNAALSVALIVSVKSTLFFSSTFGSGWFRSTAVIPRGRCSPFWDTFTAQALVVGLVFVLTNAAVIAAMPGTEGFPWATVLLGCLAVVAWSVAFGALAGVLTRPAPAAVLAASVLAASVLPAFGPFRGPLGWIAFREALLPPIGSLLSSSISGDSAAGDAIAVAAHAVLASLVAWWLFAAAVNRRQSTRE